MHRGAVTSGDEEQQTSLPGEAAEDGVGGTMPMLAQSVEVNGAKLTYLEAGAGAPVTLINGLLGDYRSWGRQIEGFGSILTPDVDPASGRYGTTSRVA